MTRDELVETFVTENAPDGGAVFTLRFPVADA